MEPPKPRIAFPPVTPPKPFSVKEPVAEKGLPRPSTTPGYRLKL